MTRQPTSRTAGPSSTPWSRAAACRQAARRSLAIRVGAGGNSICASSAATRYMRPMPKQKGGNRQHKPSNPSALRYVERTRGGSGEVYPYYKRAGRRIPLPQPEGSAEFLAAYERAAATFGPAQEAATSVSTAIDSYLASADFSQLAAASKRDYRYYLTNFNQQFGQLAMTAINSPWLEGLRDKYSESPNQWNALRARMVAVTDHFMRRH